MCKLKKLLNYEILFWIGLFTLLLFMLQNNILSADDEFCNFLTGGRISLIRYYVYGSWVMPLNNFVLYYFPQKFQMLPFMSYINLQDWAQTAGVAFEASVLTLLMVYFSKFFKLFNVQKGARLLATTFFFILFIYYMYKVQYIDLILYTGFFRFIIPSVLMVIFTYYLYKLLINKKANLLGLCALAILAASSSEVIGTISITTCVLLTIYAFYTKQEYRKNLIIITTFLIFGFLLLIFSPGFSEHVHLKLQETKTSYLSLIIGYLVPFTKVYINQLFIENIVFFIIFILLLCVPSSDGENNDKKALPICLIISCLLFCYSLIGLGNTLNDSDFWVIHPDIYTIIYIIFLTVIIMLSHNLISLYNEKGRLGIAALCLILVFLPSFYYQTKDLKSLLLNIKDATYMRDKMIFHYINSQEDVVLPFAVYRDNVYALQANMGIKFKDFYDTIRFDYWDRDDLKQVAEFEFDMLINNYFVYVYNGTIYPNHFNIEYTDGASAQEYFEERGGDISEIPQHKYRFSDLNIE